MKKIKFPISNFQFPIRGQRGFTCNEVLMVGLTLVVIWGLALVNFRGSLVRARDVQRKNDLKHIAAALNMYLKGLAFYPVSVDGKIVACGDVDKPRPCEWGEDSLGDLSEPGGAVYIERLPEDPLEPGGKYSYTYLSNTRDFQLFAHLEDRKDAEYKGNVLKRGLYCGQQICNFGVANGQIPLDTSLESLEDVE